MKTPLSSILMGSRILHSGKLDDKPEKKEKHFQILEEEALHLLALTNKVLTISRLEKGKIELNKQDVPLQPMVEKLAEKFIAKSGKPVQFSTHFDTPSVFADAEYLYEAISNLIDNAIKYSKSSVLIEISSFVEANNTVIKVKDNGIGISPKDQKVIFEKFERASAVNRVRKGRATGFGLGLNYVFHITEAHEGRVFVESIEDEFTEFILYIPQIIKEL